MEQLTITPASGDELEQAAALFAGCEPWITLGVTLEKCREACRHPDYAVYVALVGGKFCGAMVLHPHGVAGSPYLKSIAVADAFRSRGIGACLVQFAEELFRGKARHLFLCVSSFNIRARDFYQRCGFRAVGEFPDYIIEGASEILMHKRLR